MDPMINNTAISLKDNLFIFTNEYPYGTGESFIENELKVLAGKFESISLFPLKCDGPPRELVAESSVQNE